MPLADKLGRVVAALSAAGVQVVDVTYEGQIAERDTRLLTLAVLVGVLRERRRGREHRQRQDRRRAARHRGARVARARRATT